MKSIQPSRKFWLGFSMLVILFSGSCSLGRTAQRLIQIVENEKPGDQADLNQQDYEGTYHCKEESGQTFPGSLGMPAEPGVDASLVNEDLEFLFSVGQMEADGELSTFYSFQYRCASHTLTPLFFYHDRKVTHIGHLDTYLVQKTSINEGFIDQDGWFSGSWMDEKNGEVPSRDSVTDLVTTWQYIGVMDFMAGSPRIQICSWEDPPDLEAAKAAGAAGFAEFCADRNYFVCAR